MFYFNQCFRFQHWYRDRQVWLIILIESWCVNMCCIYIVWGIVIWTKVICSWRLKRVYYNCVYKIKKERNRNYVSPASPVYGVYISQLLHYCRACPQYSDFINRAQLLTQKLLKQGYVAPKLKFSLQKLYGRHHNLVESDEISISQMTMDLLLFT